VPKEFPVYRRLALPVFRPRPETEISRGSARDRGYDARWQQFSASYRRKNPFCIFCMQENSYGLCDVVDHIIPLSDGGDKYADDNLQPCCNKHHNGLKRRMERYARSRGLLKELPVWCGNPAARPEAIQVRSGKHGTRGQI
jgi:5-methylcytosine-specific restriction endonuclease McrA